MVEDEESITVPLSEALAREGFETTVAGTVADALAQARRLDPDLVLLDVMLPRRNGYEVCQLLRERPDLRDLKVVMLTAKGREAEVAKGRALGADDYVTKPFSTRELVERLDRLVGGS